MHNRTLAYKGDLFMRDKIKSMLAATLCLGTVLSTQAGDGSDESGFVPPPADRRLPPPPPRTSSSAETLDCCCCCPVTPMTRTEAKKPPKPPIAIVKIKH